MAISYGSITIVDITDISRIYMVYAKSVSNTTPPSDELTWSESIASAPGEGDFIWQKTVVEKAITEEKTYSDPVCVTGSSGQGVEKIINYYCNYGQGQPEEDYSGWQLEIPEYDESKPNYWTKVVVIYIDDTREDFQANGTIATFESERVGTLDSLEVSLSSIQDLHGYDKPWVGGGGKNLFEPWSATHNGVTFTPQSDGTVKISGTTTGVSWVQAYKEYPISDFGLSIGDSVYSYSNGNVVGGDEFISFVRFYDGNDTSLSTVTAGTVGIVPSGAEKIRLYMYGFGSTSPSAGTVVNKVGYFEFGKGSTVPTEWTPYTNICPISGWDSVEMVVSGKNLFDYSACQNQTISGTGVISNANTRLLSPIFSVKANETYFISFPTGVKFIGFVEYDADGAWKQNVFTNNTIGVTISPTTNNIRLYFSKTDTSATMTVEEISGTQLELGSTATDYEPYDGQTITTTLPTTVYGGTLDVVSGVLTVDRAIVDLGTLNWGYSSADARFYNGDIDYKRPASATDVANAVCSQYEIVKLGVLADGKMCLYTNGYTYVKDSRYTDATVFKSAVSGQTLVYELATPTTIQCDPQTVQTLIGDNNVWSDGTVEIRGHTISKRDVMIYKDNGLTDVVNKSAEALEKANDGIVSTTQLWYQTNSTGAPSVPTSHSQIDQGTITYNNWRSARPNNNVDSYKYYYYCYEYLHGDGTYTYSAEVILDTSNLSQYQIDQLQTRVKKIWSNSTGSYMASGIGTNEVDINNSSTYGFNSKSTTTGVSFNYNTIPLTSLGTDGVNLYSPTLTNGVITGSRLDATLSTNGLILNKGGIKAREGYSDFIYLSTDSYGNYSINGSTGISDWKQIIGTKFGVRTDGTLYASSANIQGILTAGAGSAIGPWTVSNNAIYNPSTKSSINSDSVDGVYIGTDGIALGQGTFKVTDEGELYATDVDISGVIAATDGFTVTQNGNNIVTMNSSGVSFANDKNFYFGNNNAYIAFNSSNNGSITIGGNAINIGTNKTLSQLLADVVTAQNTADSKSKVFKTTDTTITDYAVGDMWVRTTTSIDETTGETISITTTLVCVSAYGTAFDEDDWVVASTDDSTVDNVQQSVEALNKSTDEMFVDISNTLQGTTTDEGVLESLSRLSANLATLGDEYHTAWEGINSFIKILEVAGQPQMILGSDVSDWNVVITDTDMTFRNNDTPVAYINAEGLHVRDYLSFGNFQFYQRPNYHFTLKFIGGNS